MLLEKWNQNPHQPETRQVKPKDKTIVNHQVGMEMREGHQLALEAAVVKEVVAVKEAAVVEECTAVAEERAAVAVEDTVKK